MYYVCVRRFFGFVFFNERKNAIPRDWNFLPWTIHQGSRHFFQIFWECSWNLQGELEDAKWRVCLSPVNFTLIFTRTFYTWYLPPTPRNILTTALLCGFAIEFEFRCLWNRCVREIFHPHFVSNKYRIMIIIAYFLHLLLPVLEVTAEKQSMQWLLPPMSKGPEARDVFAKQKRQHSIMTAFNDSERSWRWLR